MLLTFIFNYFPSRLCDVATSPSSSSLSCPAQSSISHSFSVYQVDIFMLQTDTHTHTHIRAHKSPTRGEGNIKKILFLAKHEESAERAESHDRRRFFYRKYGRKTWACVGGEHRRHVFRCKRKHFLTKTSHSSIFPPPASELSFVKTRRLFSGRLFPSRFSTTLRFRCIRSRRGALADASTKWSALEDVEQSMPDATFTDILLRSLKSVFFWDVACCCCITHTSGSRLLFCREIKKLFPWEYINGEWKHSVSMVFCFHVDVFVVSNEQSFGVFSRQKILRRMIAGRRLT